MTGEQFDTLQKLMRGNPESPSARAGRKVIVDGIPPAIAMRETGASRSNVHDSVKRYTEADLMVKKAYIEGGESMTVNIELQRESLEALGRGMLKIRNTDSIEESREIADELHNIPVLLTQLANNPTESRDIEDQLKMYLSQIKA